MQIRTALTLKADEMSITALKWSFKVYGISSPSAQLVLTTLAWHSNPDSGDAWPTVSTLIEETKLSRRAIMKWLQWLQNRGFTQRLGKKGRAVVYHLNLQNNGLERTNDWKKLTFPSNGANAGIASVRRGPVSERHLDMCTRCTPTVHQKP